MTFKSTVASVIALGPWGWGALSMGCVGVLIWLALIFVIEPRHATVVKAETKVAGVEQKVEGQATQTVITLQHQNDQKAATAERRHTENLNVIQKLPSSTSTIPDSDADAFLAGLCVYDSTNSDSTCTRLQKTGHP